MSEPKYEKKGGEEEDKQKKKTNLQPVIEPPEGSSHFSAPLFTRAALLEIDRLI